jgi:biotin synthase-related radical SAM superfamily protein
MKALVIAFDNVRVKLTALTQDEYIHMSNREREGLEYTLAEQEGKYVILKGNDIYLDNVKIISTLLHAPEQAFINLSSTCIYNCKFCATPRLKSREKLRMNIDSIVKSILRVASRPTFKSVAITSGVVGSPSETIMRLVALIRKVRFALPDVPIGVEPYVTIARDIDRLYEAGATELKLNIQSYDRVIFAKICPELNFDNILAMIEYGAHVFGKGKVCSNIILGLGESDATVLAGVEHLAKIGAVATLRAVRVNAYNYTPLVNALGREPECVPATRLIQLALSQKEILARYGLTTRSFLSMCHRCGCCDLVPFQDL